MCFPISIRAAAKWAVSVLPANHCAAPKCRTQRPCVQLVLRQSAHACNSRLRHQSSTARSRGIRRHCPALEHAQSHITSIEAVSANVFRHRPKPWRLWALARSRMARLVRGLSCGSPGSNGAIKFSAKCSNTLGKRWRSNATAKHRQQNTGIRVLSALYFAHQPNRKFEWDNNASHHCPSTWALAFL